MRTCLLPVVMLLAGKLEGQQWNDARVLDLVRQATDRRARQLADSGLVDYRATAHGYLTFLAQLGEGFREPPQIVKADELALQVNWRAPNHSKQVIIGRRDTTLLPTDINYHRDHLGIVQNNFPAIIRLGDGDEVKDVPHPLSATGLAEYDFALTDSLRITSPGRVISVYEVKVRPRDDRLPRVIGALYLDRDNAQVVRLALSFTRAAFLDKDLEDLFIVLENGLVGAQFWLPRRQEIEIRRTATWLDYPVRGIIRGRWEIGEYQLNAGIPISVFAGPEIVAAPARTLRAYAWPSARILDSLPPDIRAVTADEIQRVQTEVRALVREQALQRARGSALAARGASDFVRFNRVEGVALGGGIAWRLGRGARLTSTARYGMQDRAGKGRVELGWQNAAGTSLRAYYGSDFRDVGDIAERSLVVNSLAAQEFGSDFTNPYRVIHGGLGVGVQRNAVRYSLDVTRERHRPLFVHATPAFGTFEPVVDAAPIDLWRASLRAERPTLLAPWGIEVRGTVETRVTRTIASAMPCGTAPCPATTVARAAATLELERPWGSGGDARWTARTFAAHLHGSPPIAQDLVFLGGTWSAPGYPFHSLVGRSAISQRIEWHAPVPFVAIGLGRFGRSPSRATLAPHLSGAFVRQAAVATLLRSATVPPTPDPLQPRPGGFYPSAGLSLIAAFDLFRVDVSRGLRDGVWAFSFDVSRAFWGIL